MKLETAITLASEETKLHHSACELARQHRASELGLCQVLREIGQSKLYLKLGYARLFYYATEELKLTKSVAYTTITVARQTAKFPELKVAIDDGRLSVSKASRIVSSLTAENASELIGYAITHTSEEIDEEIARRNPEKLKRDRSRHVGNDKVELCGQISVATHKLLKRAKSVLASKGKPTTLDGVLETALNLYLDHHDPVRKAERAKAKRDKRNDDFCLNRNHEPAGAATASAVGQIPVSKPGTMQSKQANPRTTREMIHQTQPQAQTTREMIRRTQPRAWVKHQVMLRTGGRCTFVNERGERCSEDRWLDLHHIIPVSKGGTDEPSNLTCLCSAHHALVHQLGFPIEGQITWLRSPSVAYQPC